MAKTINPSWSLEQAKVHAGSCENISNMSFLKLVIHQPPSEDVWSTVWVYPVTTLSWRKSWLAAAKMECVACPPWFRVHQRISLRGIGHVGRKAMFTSRHRVKECDFDVLFS